MVAALLLIGLVFRSLIAVLLPVGFDEAYYYLYTLHPDWSYFDHPPLVALSTGFGIALSGVVSPLTIRIGALLLYTGALIFLYLTGVKLFSRSVAVMSLAIVTLVPIFQVGFGVLTLPDNALMLFWSACLYVSADEFFTHPTHYKPTFRLALIGLLVGFACLGKYHGFVLGFGLVLFVLLSRRHRSALTSPWLGVGVILFALALSPVIVWNAQHEWISLVYQSNRAVPHQRYVFTQSIVTWLLGIAYLFPPLGFPLWWAIGRSSQKVISSYFTPAFSTHPLYPKHLLLLCVSLPLIVGLLYVGGYQAILPTWQMPGFFSASLLLGEAAIQWQVQRPRLVHGWLLGSGITITLILLITLAHVRFGILQKPGGWFGGIVPIATDASTQMINIHDLRQGFQESPQLQYALQTNDFVFTNQIFIAGQIAMAIAPLSPPPITCFSEDLRGFAFWSDSSNWIGKHALYITSARFEQEGIEQEGIKQDELKQDGKEQTPFTNYFRSLSPLTEIPLKRAGHVVETFKIFQADTLLTPYPRPYGS